jgi:hypothetical protein
MLICERFFSTPPVTGDVAGFSGAHADKRDKHTNPAISHGILLVVIGLPSRNGMAPSRPRFMTATDTSSSLKMVSAAVIDLAHPVDRLSVFIF